MMRHNDPVPDSVHRAMGTENNVCVLEAEAFGKVVDTVEKRVDRFHAAHREDDLVFVNKGFEANDYIIHVGNVVLAVLVLSKLLLGPVLQVEDTKLPEGAMDRSWDTRERGGIEIVLDVTKPWLVSTSAEVHWYPNRYNRRGYTGRHSRSYRGVRGGRRCRR